MKRFFSLIVLAGCMVGPNYHPPHVSVPLQFTESADSTPLSDDALCLWWEQFEDPVLNDLIRQAVTSNFDYRIALEQMFQARAEYQIESSFLWPTIDLNASAVRSRFSQTVSDFQSSNVQASGAPNTLSSGATVGRVSAVQNFFQVGFDAIWELDFWGKFRRAKRETYDLWEASGYTAQNVLIMVISEVARSYTSIRGLQTQVELLQKKIKAEEEGLKLAQDLFQSGLNSEIELAAFILAIENDKATLPRLEIALKQTLYSLGVVLGKPSEEIVSILEAAGPIPKAVGRVSSGLPSELLRRRPDIRAAERQLAASAEEIGVNVANLFPHIALTGDRFGYESNKLSRLFSPMSRYWTIGPSVNWNVLDFGKIRGEIAVAKSLHRQAFLNYEKTVIAALQDVEGALVAYYEEEKRYSYLYSAYEAQNLTYLLTQNLFNAGLVSWIELLEALKIAIDAELFLIQSSQSMTFNLISLYKALGGDWECTCTP